MAFLASRLPLLGIQNLDFSALPQKLVSLRCKCSSFKFCPSIFYSISNSTSSFGAPGVEYYGQLERETNISHLYFVPGQVYAFMMFIRDEPVSAVIALKHCHHIANLSF